MLYSLLHYLLRLSLNRHYEEIKSFNQSAVPQSGPLIIAASHPNSFLDAIIIAITLKRPLYFLARSDVFRKKWSNYILRKLNLIPIYRLSEGKEHMHLNQKTFADCHEVLANEGALLIFAEGISVGDKQIRPLKKGLARIAFGYLSEFPEKAAPQIVACGINYEHINQFGSRVLVGYSNPIAWDDLHSDYGKNANQAFIQLNQRISSALKEHSIEVEPEDESFHQALVELDPCYEQNSLIRKALIAKKVDDLKVENPKKYKQLKKEVKKMERILHSYHLDFQSMKHKVEVEAKDFVIYFLLSPLALVGYLLNCIPYLLAHKIAKRTTAKDPEFYLSVRFSCGSLLWLLWSTIIALSLSLIFNWWFILSPIALFVLAKIYFKNKRRWQLILRLRWIKKMKSNQADLADVQEEIRRILKLRSSLGLMTKSKRST